MLPDFGDQGICAFGFEPDDQFAVMADGLVPACEAPAGFEFVGQAEYFGFEQLFFSVAECVVDAGEDGRDQPLSDLILFDDAVGGRFHAGDVFFQCAGHRFFADQFVEVAGQQIVGIVGRCFVSGVAQRLSFMVGKARL